MNIKDGIPQIVMELKNNIANQANPDLIACDLEEISENAGSVDQDGQKILAQIESRGFSGDCNGKDETSVDELFLAKIYSQRMSMIGMEMVVSLCVSYMIAWGIGYLFTLSSFWRIILGTLLAFAVNALAVYRMIMR